MLCMDVLLKMLKRSPQNPPVHLTAVMGVAFIMANLLFCVSVMPSLPAVAVRGSKTVIVIIILTTMFLFCLVVLCLMMFLFCID